mmetsp:Transcript_158911/g.509697  ORF Transcript_158911/g.509697 Transcript_158911/m.509697 type:complete len:204 (+) Transcript_158911:1093-1704(+)
MASRAATEDRGSQLQPLECLAQLPVGHFVSLSLPLKRLLLLLLLPVLTLLFLALVQAPSAHWPLPIRFVPEGPPILAASTQCALGHALLLLQLLQTWYARRTFPICLLPEGVDVLALQTCDTHRPKSFFVCLFNAFFARSARQAVLLLLLVKGLTWHLPAACRAHQHVACGIRNCCISTSNCWGSDCWFGRSRRQACFLAVCR